MHDDLTGLLNRRALDNAGHGSVQIVASGGFDAPRIREFEQAGVPVDAYGVGTSLLRGSNDFTADVVRVNGVPCAKVGREERPNPRLEPVASPRGDRRRREWPAPPVAARRRAAWLFRGCVAERRIYHPRHASRTLAAERARRRRG